MELEFVDFSAFLRPGSPDKKTINEVFNKFGPIPRVCLETASDVDEIKIYSDQLQNDIDRLTPKTLKDMVYDLRNFNMDETSHKLCIIRRPADTTIKGGFYVTPITGYVTSRLGISMQNQDMRDLIDTFERLHGLSISRGMSGIIFENICHQILGRKIDATLVPMVRLQSKAERQPYWHSSHEWIRDVSGKANFHSSSTLHQLAQKATSRKFPR